jgi:ketosteroid isomerase-like protein
MRREPRCARRACNVLAERKSGTIELDGRDPGGASGARYCAARSQENVELVRRAVKAFNDRDIAALADIVTEDHEFIPYLAAGVEKTTIYRGRGGLREYQRDADEAWESIHARVDEIRDLGDRVVAFGEIRARGRSSGLDTRVPLAWLIEFRDGKLWRNRSYGDKDEALEAAGRSE